MTSPQPIACGLGAGDMDARERAWRAVGVAALRARTAIPNGVRLEFEPGRETAHALLDLVAAERDCCAWASWILVSAGEATVVEATADQSGTPALHAMFEVGP